MLLAREGYIGCPYGYGNSVNSTWLVNIIGDFIVRLDFLSFSTEEQHDYVSVYDGNSRSAPLLGHFSGQTLPDPITSSGHQLFVSFTSNPTHVAAGFTATYQSVHALQPSGCSRSGTFTLTDSQDSLGCEGYLSNVVETWILVSQSAHEVINLTWQTFNTQEDHDFVKVYDGNTTDSTLIYSVSGTTLPDPAVSTGRYLLVQFTADSDAVTGSGFGAVYESVLVPESDATSCQTSQSYTLLEQEGTFGCDGYANSVTVSWLIHVSDGYTIGVQFNTFFTEGLYDFVTVYDGPDNTATAMGSWSGAFRPPTLSSTSNYLYVVFTSDAGVTRSGFSASYNSIFSGHTGSSSCFTSQSHTLTDSNGDFGCDGYGNNVIISWLITTEHDTSISLEFVDFQTELNYDVLTIYDGTSSNSRVLATYSGYILPLPVQSSSNNLFVKFASDDSVNYDGFTIRYHSQDTIVGIGACNTSTHTTLTDPSGQFGCNGYGNSIDSTWSISLEEGQRITLSFTLLSTELYYDYVKIYDGSGTRSTLLGTYSGENLPSAITSSGNAIYVVFHSDSSVSSSYSGFTIQYVSFGSFEANCVSSQSYHITGASGTFGCDGYGSSVTVTWLIESFGNIFVNFDQFNTELNYDLVRIYDGSSDSAPLIATYSGTTAPPISSAGNSMFIKFTSDSSITRTGFSATFATIIIDMMEN